MPTIELRHRRHQTVLRPPPRGKLQSLVEHESRIVQRQLFGRLLSCRRLVGIAQQASDEPVEPSALAGENGALSGRCGTRPILCRRRNRRKQGDKFGIGVAAGEGMEALALPAMREIDAQHRLDPRGQRLGRH